LQQTHRFRKPQQYHHCQPSHPFRQKE
jgi:hypothetical protein